MFAKASLIFTLLVSLLFMTQASPLAAAPEMKPGGLCAGKSCALGCCDREACCKVTEQQKAPQPPTPAPHYAHVQIATLGLHLYTFLFLPPAREPSFVIRDEVRTAHTLPPRAANCIQLI